MNSKSNNNGSGKKEEKPSSMEAFVLMPSQEYMASGHRPNPQRGDALMEQFAQRLEEEAGYDLRRSILTYGVRSAILFGGWEESSEQLKALDYVESASVLLEKLDEIADRMSTPMRVFDFLVSMGTSYSKAGVLLNDALDNIRCELEAQVQRAQKETELEIMLRSIESAIQQTLREHPDDSPLKMEDEEESEEEED
jgi:hypothetical protein